MADLERREKLGKGWDRKKRKWYLKLFDGLRGKLTWRDFIIGFLAAVVISAILAGFRHQVLPEFEVGETADQDVRASKDAQYVDNAATDMKREEAEKNVPLVYRQNQDLVIERENIIKKVFSDARSLLDANGIAPGQEYSIDTEQNLINELKIQLGDTFPEELLKVLLRERFNVELENTILKVLRTVLQEGIIESREKFEAEQRTGIVIQNSSSPYQQHLTDVSRIRDLAEAGKYLRQFDQEFPRWNRRAKDALLLHLETLLVPTLVYDSEETEKNRKLAAAQVPDMEVRIKRGQTLVRYGERLTEDLVRQMNILREMWKPSSILLQGMGYFLFVSILLYALWRYFVFFQSRHKKIRNHAMLILVIITSELLIVRLATVFADILDERYQRFNDPAILYFAIPFALGPLLATLLIDANLGIVTSLILATLIGLFYGDMDTAVYLIMGSLAGIYSIRQYTDRAAILKAGLSIAALNCICLTGLNILQQNPIKLSTGIDLMAVSLLSGLLASTVASIMLPALEFFFKIVTDIRLLELSNLNAPILRRLSVEAPGTYHHSLMVATLAEDAAESIRVNPLLTRVSAYYHDIGKILKPEYFVENQSLDYNKHEEISPRMSSMVLSRHVKDGIQLAKEIGLPQSIRDMIPQHHGTRMMSFFFRKAKDTVDSKNGSVSDSDYRYAGPKPQSKEAAIMMMADSVEAASRTLTDPSPNQIRGMIDRLVDGIIGDDQFDECDITLSDVRLVKESFFKILTGIFHKRIDYPEYDFKDNNTESEGPAGANTDSQ